MGLPDPGIELGSPALLVDSLPAELPGKPWKVVQTITKESRLFLHHFSTISHSIPIKPLLIMPSFYIHMIITYANIFCFVVLCFNALCRYYIFFYKLKFCSNSMLSKTIGAIRSHHVSVSHFGNSCNISNFFIIIIHYSDQRSLMLQLELFGDIIKHTHIRQPT